MNTKLILFLALLAMTLSPAFGGLLKGWADDKLDSGPNKHSDASAETTVAANVDVNPSSPPAASESQTLLYGTTVDVDVKKVPLVTVSDAPCKNVCKNVCKLDFTQSCKKVPVKSKECIPTKKTLKKKICSKKCSLTVETPKIIKRITPAQPETPPSPPTPVMPEVPSPPSPPDNPKPSAPEYYPNPSAPEYYPNPSNPPAYYPNPSAPQAAYPNPSAQPAVTATVDDSQMMASETQLPALNTVYEADTMVDVDSTDVNADTDTSSSRGRRRLSGLLAAKAVVASKLVKILPVPDCNEVCQDVEFEVPEIECEIVHSEVESCRTVPTKNCEQKCVCLPQKSFDINVPKKTIDVSFSKEGAAHVAAADDVSVSASASVDVAVGGEDV